MTNMKINRANADSCNSCIPNDGPEYPYGLRICLNTDSLKALGIETLPDLGAELTIKAKVSVCGVCESKNLYGTDRNLDLQITDMELKGV